MLANYLKVAVAVLARRKVFTAISLLGITFTLTVLLAVAAILDHIFGSIPPEVHQHRSLSVIHASLSGERGRRSSALSRGFLERTLRDLPGAEDVTIVSVAKVVTSFQQGQRLESFLKYVDAGFWRVMAFDFIEGRSFSADEVRTGAAVAVINRATRERFFDGRSALDGMVEVDGRRYRVVGVVENVPFFRLIPFGDIWVPYTTDTAVVNGNLVLGNCMGVVLARSRRDFAAIRAEYLSRVAATDLSAEGRFDTLITVPESPFQMASRIVLAGARSTDSHVGGLLGLLAALMVLFMVLPSINLVNLSISRIMERASEIGVRKAFGASAATLIGQFVVENLVLTLGGAVLALAGAYGVLALIAASGLVPYAQFHLNWRIFAIAVLVAMVFGLISGVYPAWRMARMNPVDALRGGVS